MTVQVEDAHFSHACISSLECKWVLVCRCLECFCLFSGDINRIRKFMRWHGICCSYTWFICIYTILESHNPIFFGQTALNHFCLSLRLWSSGATSVRVATAFLRPFFNKMSKKYGFAIATGRLVWELLRFFTFFFQQILKNTVLLRVGLQCSFDLNIFLVITGKNNILPKKKFITVISHSDQKIVCFWLSRMLIV